MATWPEFYRGNIGYKLASELLQNWRKHNISWGKNFLRHVAKQERKWRTREREREREGRRKPRLSVGVLTD